MTLRTSAGIAAFLALAFALATPAAARTLLVGGPGAYPTLAAAASAARPHDTIRLSAGIYHECAVLAQDGLVLEGAGIGASVIAGVACEDKAALVTRGAGITVRDLTLASVHVPAGNGAGIRAEGADLVVAHVRFTENENGILSAPRAGSTITVSDSEFLRNGACAADCAHAIYAGHIARLVVLRSRFEGTRVAHAIKSRAAATEVIGCTIADGAGGTGSYMIELPNGGGLLARDNLFEKGPLSSNPDVISIGAEGASEPAGPVVVEGNRLRVAGTLHFVFVHNRTTTPARLEGNRLPEGVTALIGAGSLR